MLAKQLATGIACLLGVVTICLMVNMTMKQEYDPFVIMGLVINAIVAYLLFQFTQRADFGKNHKLLLVADIQSIIESLNRLQTDVLTNSDFGIKQRGLALEEISITISDLKDVAECSAIDLATLSLDNIGPLFLSYMDIVTSDFERTLPNRLSETFLSELTTAYRILRSALLRLRLDIHSSSLRDF